MDFKCLAFVPSNETYYCYSFKMSDWQYNPFLRPCSLHVSICPLGQGQLFSHGYHAWLVPDAVGPLLWGLAATQRHTIAWDGCTDRWQGLLFPMYMLTTADSCTISGWILDLEDAASADPPVRFIPRRDWTG